MQTNLQSRRSIFSPSLRRRQVLNMLATGKPRYWTQTRNTIGHFRISLNLFEFLKAILGAHPFIWKWDFIHMQINHMNGCAPGLALMERIRWTRKWAIVNCIRPFPHSIKTMAPSRGQGGQTYKRMTMSSLGLVLLFVEMEFGKGLLLVVRTILTYRYVF